MRIFVRKMWWLRTNLRYIYEENVFIEKHNLKNKDNNEIRKEENETKEIKAKV